jgi:hypothetical protein
MADIEAGFSAQAITYERRVFPGFYDVKTDQLRMVQYRVDVSDAAGAQGVVDSVDGVFDPGGQGGPAPDPIFALDLATTDGLTSQATALLTNQFVDTRWAVSRTGGRFVSAGFLDDSTQSGGTADPAGNKYVDGAANPDPQTYDTMTVEFRNGDTSDMVFPDADLVVKDALGVTHPISSGSAGSVTIPKTLVASGQRVVFCFLGENGLLYKFFENDSGNVLQPIIGYREAVRNGPL